MIVKYAITLELEVEPDPDGWVSAGSLDRLDSLIESVVEWSTACEAIETGIAGSDEWYDHALVNSLRCDGRIRSVVDE